MLLFLCEMFFPLTVNFSDFMSDLKYHLLRKTPINTMLSDAVFSPTFPSTLAHCTLQFPPDSI